MLVFKKKWCQNQLTILVLCSSPVQSRSSTFSTDAERPPPINAQNLNANAFNQGYYSKFFVEMNKLGKGFRGSVFLCEVNHITRRGRGGGVYTKY